MNLHLLVVVRITRNNAFRLSFQSIDPLSYIISSSLFQPVIAKCEALMDFFIVHLNLLQRLELLAHTHILLALDPLI